MTDLWYSYGAMVADMGLLSQIMNLHPKFQAIQMTVTETVNGVTTSYSNPAAGYLDDQSTTSVREAIRDYAAAHLTPGAPPISLYTAGKFCQMLNTFSALAGTLSQANTAFTTAGGNANASPGLLMILGLCLLDSNFVTGVLRGPDQSVIDATAREFGLDQQGAEWQTLQKTLNDQNFGQAHAALFAAPCWIPGLACVESMVFYGSFMRAVN